MCGFLKNNYIWHERKLKSPLSLTLYSRQNQSNSKQAKNKVNYAMLNFQAMEVIQNLISEREVDRKKEGKWREEEKRKKLEKPEKRKKKEDNN